MPCSTTSACLRRPPAEEAEAASREEEAFPAAEWAAEEEAPGKEVPGKDAPDKESISGKTKILVKRLPWVYSCGGLFYPIGNIVVSHFFIFDRTLNEL